MTAAPPETRRHGIGNDLPLLAEAFQLGPLSSDDLQYLPDGMMNRNWRIDTTDGVFALKQIIDVAPEKARRSLQAVQALGAAGLPVCPPRPLPNGDLVADIDGRAYCLLPWASGRHRHGVNLTGAEAGELGKLLALVHRALSSPATGLEQASAPPRAKVTPPEAALAEADRFLDVITNLAEPGPFDSAAAEALRRRKELINEHAGDRPASEVPAGPAGWTHGDFQPLNLLWHQGRVSAVLDWDRLAPRPLAEELARTAQVQFTDQDGRLHLELVAAFTTAYRQAMPLADEDLVDAVARLWWKRATDFWQLQWHYDKNDTGPDHLWVTGERLLHWWTTHRDRVTAAFTS